MGHDWHFKSTWPIKNNNPLTYNLSTTQAMAAVNLDMCLTDFSGLDRGRPCGSVGCQSKQDLLDGIRESLEGVMVLHRRPRPCCHWLSDWQRGEWKTRNTHSCGAPTWYLHCLDQLVTALAKWLLCENIKPSVRNICHPFVPKAF